MVGIENTILNRQRTGTERVGRVAAWDARCRASRRIELSQSIELLRGKTVRGPILRQCTEVVVEGAVLLGHDNDVIDALQASLRTWCAWCACSGGQSLAAG